jgi:alcohol dehydrogenase
VRVRSRSLMLQGLRRLEWVEEELPLPGSGEVLIRTVSGAVSIGSELPHYLGTGRHSAPDTYPRMTGYESVGIVLACGPDVQRLRPGDRVFSFYGHRTHAVVAEARAIPVSPDIGDRLALLAILSCDVAKGIRAVHPWIGEPALVTGAGTIGLLAVWTLRQLGIIDVDVLEPLSARRELALQLGARRAFSPDELPPSGERYPLGFECSSQNAAFAVLQATMRREGRICVLADGNLEPLVLTSYFHEKELRILASSDGWDYTQHAAWYFETARTQGAALEAIFDYEAPASELAQTFERMATGDIRPIKVFVRYDE